MESCVNKMLRRLKRRLTSHRCFINFISNTFFPKYFHCLLTTIHKFCEINGEFYRAIFSLRKFLSRARPQSSSWITLSRRQGDFAERGTPSAERRMTLSVVIRVRKTETEVNRVPFRVIILGTQTWNFIYSVS